ncbi:asparaginase domain-containing protein [Guyparkeria sp. 1SP6A2]|nr:asparaginase domain-containing protein [Guyparkeria sp. 1SP6A2]
MTDVKKAHKCLPVILMDTGGTFNKCYEPVSGNLVVQPGSQAARAILTSASVNLDLRWSQPVCKDSLDMTDGDRAEIVHAVEAFDGRWAKAPVVLLHGTDSMTQTAAWLDRALPDRLVVLTGSMRPFEIDPVESALNLGLALGFIQGCPGVGVHLAMTGLVRPLGALEKDRGNGCFRPG